MGLPASGPSCCGPPDRAEVRLLSPVSSGEEIEYSSAVGVVMGALALTVTPRGQGRGEDIQGGSCLEP